MSDVLDGNAAGGALAEALRQELTAARTTCAACGDVRAIGELQAYVSSPGMVLRCATCEAVQVRLVRGPSHAWLDLRGIQVLQVEFPSSD